jgi:hypothetical protein
MPDDRRFQIFVSSTFQDLAEQRKQAIEVIFERGHIPITMEGFSASHASDREVITNAIADSQVYVVILGHRYGELVPGQDISYTEWEFDLAEHYGLHVLAFILNEGEIEERRHELQPGNTRDSAELNNRARLITFHNRVQKHCRKWWSAQSQFKAIVLQSLVDELPKVNKLGFIREDNHPDYSLLAEAQDKRAHCWFVSRRADGIECVQD